MNTEELIKKLSKEQNKNILQAPSYYIKNLSILMLIYAIFMAVVAGVHKNIFSYLQNPFLIAELTGLIFITIFSIVGGVFSLYPDNFQNNSKISRPIKSFLGFLMIIMTYCGYEFIKEAEILFRHLPSHNIECSLSIMGMSVLPSALMFFIINKGATTNSLSAGFYSVLASSALSGFILRLAEADASLFHVLIWHYIPIFLFSTCGAFLGKWLLKW